MHLQRRVWNLLAKGRVFEDMVQHPEIVAIASAFLGTKFHLGSIAANRLLPGGPGQEPHIDYPYWDMYERDGFPARMNSSYPLNLQVTIPLDPFNEISGASAYLPGSQHDLRYPEVEDREAFFATCSRMSGSPGDAVIFNGMVWHCAMPNTSEHNRSAVLIEYLPKFVIPLEDQLSGVTQEVLDRASPLLQRLIGVGRPYPKLFDQADGANTIGRD
jgi:ectoine hydroxylase-related dioxygenase (phytanoyl-CoA dioxygenase family)